MSEAHARPTLQIVIASTRPGRVGGPVADWFETRVRRHDAFGVDVADLAVLDLPFMNEPRHPRLGRYEHAHTNAWSARVDAADAFAFVLPEYNHGPAAPLKNAIDYLHREWAYKPVGFVSYGGVSAGTRAADALRPVVTTLRMMPVPDAVHVPFVAGFLEDGEIRANDAMNAGADRMLDELARWERALRPLREEGPPGA